MPALTILTFLASASIQSSSVLRAGQEPQASVISVGPNVQVSKQFSTLPHYENLASGDPDHAGHLLACSGVLHEERSEGGPYCYASFDGGNTWSLVLQADQGRAVGDPTMAYGRADTVYFTNIVRPREVFTRHIRLYRSVDGGKTWKNMGLFPFVDRQTLVVDRTGGKYAGRLYYTGEVAIRGIDGKEVPAIHLFTSTDGGTTFSGHVLRATFDGGSLSTPSTSVVLSDGTLAFLIEHGRGTGPQVQLQLLTSSDGGDSLNAPVTVGEWSRDFGKSQGGLFAQLAVDPGSLVFKDRLYAVWPDDASGRIEIRFAYSADSGKSWSVPIVVNDDRPPTDKDHGPDQMLPAVAVNQQGAVLVTWYDRRRSGDNMGWEIRVAASLDGGETFTPSRVVSEAPNVYTQRTQWILEREPTVVGGGTPRPSPGPMGRPLGVDVTLNDFFLSGGHTSGLAVDADGVFHPVWVDNRTGVPQLWTARVSVAGDVQTHGARNLTALDDLTDRVTLIVHANDYDRSTNTLTITASLKNTSRDTVRAPLYARLITLTSELGVTAALGADNGVEGVGAVWDLGSTIPAAGLAPDGSSASRTFAFRLSDLRPLQATKERPNFTSGLVHFELRVYGRK